MHHVNPNKRKLDNVEEAIDRKVSFTLTLIICVGGDFPNWEGQLDYWEGVQRENGLRAQKHCGWVYGEGRNKFVLIR